MEFLENYNTIIENETTIIKKFIVDCLKKNKEEGRSFRKAFSNTEEKVWDDFTNKNLINKYRNELFSYYNLFNESLRDYDSEKVDEIKSVLKNEIHNKFLSFKDISKIPNLEYHDDFNNLTFEQLVEQLLKLHVVNKLHQRLKDNNEIFKLYYENDYYKKINLDKIDGHIINSVEYKILFKKFYPEKEVPIVTEKKDEFGNSSSEIIRNDKNDKIKLSNELLKSTITKPEFKLDEKLLILNLCLADINSIPNTEKVKLIIIIGEINDFTIFKESSNDNQLYAKVMKGADRKGSIINTIKLVENVLLKLEPFELNITNQRLNLLKTKLINEQNKAKK